VKIFDRVRHRDGSAADARATGATPASERPAPPAVQAEAERSAQEVPGGEADKPQDIPKEGWVQIAKRGWNEAKADNVPLMAAGVAFYGFLSIFPALIALVLLYGLVYDPSQVEQQINNLGAALPQSAQELLTNQLRQLASTSSTGLGWGLVSSLALALWSASNGVNNLMKAVNIAYDEEEERGFLKLRGIALLLTLGAIIVVVLALALVAVLPAVLGALQLSTIATVGVQVARWLLLLGIIVVALAVVYRVAPDRDSPKFTWVSVGAGVATVLWLVVSVGFTVYANVANYGSAYGSLAGVVVLLMWLWLSAYAILLGAEINAESEQQTIRDTTKGPEEPLGTRGAVKADTAPA
jgi:membrane protein